MADDSEDEYDDWMENDEGADCPDFHREDPGKQYYVQYYAFLWHIV